ncbi:hypothetical protein NMG60_11014844 [Bertholletia excelsa]
MDEGRRGEGVNQQQQEDPSNNQRRLKPPENQPLQPQKCPRCDSVNTKFCYYNNYSLSQPRYFCKTCRRYWTHGGTLRNVPVGGGCRKGKRQKAGDNSRSQPPQTTEPPSISVVPPASTYFSGGGFLSSLAAVQSLSHHQQQQPPFSLGQFGPGSGSNLGLLQGLNVFGVGSSHGPQIQQQQSDQVYQMGNRVKNEETLYSSGQTLVDQTSRPSGYWSQTLVSNSGTNTTGSNPSRFWSGTTNSSTTGINPNQWPDLPGYGHTP